MLEKSVMDHPSCAGEHYEKGSAAVSSASGTLDAIGWTLNYRFDKRRSTVAEFGAAAQPSFRHQHYEKSILYSTSRDCP